MVLPVAKAGSVTQTVTFNHGPSVDAIWTGLELSVAVSSLGTSRLGTEQSNEYHRRRPDPCARGPPYARGVRRRAGDGLLLEIPAVDC